MRYCEQCGYVMDELCCDRDLENCPVCGWMWTEDDMTALKYEQLSEAQKDAYDEQLLAIIRRSPLFNERSFESANSVRTGNFWQGFRVDKWMKTYPPYCPEPLEEMDRIVEERQARTFLPFPVINEERARRHALECLINRWGYEDEYIKKDEILNVPRCPVCQSTRLYKLRTMDKYFLTPGGIYSGMASKTYECNNCGYIF